MNTSQPFRTQKSSWKIRSTPNWRHRAALRGRHRYAGPDLIFFHDPLHRLASDFSHTSTVNHEMIKLRSMVQDEIPPEETASGRKVIQISSMVHADKDWAFIALCDDGSLWLYHGSWSRLEGIPQTPDL